MNTTTANHRIAVTGLTKKYGGRTVVDSLSFTAEPGRVTGFLGPNGSGKSTTMKMMLGISHADAGTATISGQRYRDLPHPAKAVGAMIEPDAFHPGRSGRNHLRVVADAARIDHSRVDEVLDEVGLSAAGNRRVGTYSLGMKQRLGLATALLGRPQVLILDEPANGLDPEGIRALREQLRAEADRGVTVFVSSHLLDEMEHMADDVVVIAGGKLIADGPLAELQRESVLVRSADQSLLAASVARVGATVDKTADGALLVQGATAQAIGEAAFAAGVAVHELARQSGSLEEMFLTWTTTPKEAK